MNLNDRASSAVLKKHLFKEHVNFIAINVNTSYPSDSTIQDLNKKYPNLSHFWMDQSGAIALKIQFVPSRLIINEKGQISKWWDGTHGNVVGGRHGKSRENGSTEFTDIVAKLIKEKSAKKQ